MTFKATLTSMVDPLSPIYSVAVANSRICTVFTGYPEIREFATAITQNISDLESQPWKSRLFDFSNNLDFKQPFSVR